MLAIITLGQRLAVNPMHFMPHLGSQFICFYFSRGVVFMHTDSPLNFNYFQITEKLNHTNHSLF